MAKKAVDPALIALISAGTATAEQVAAVKAAGDETAVVDPPAGGEAAAEVKPGEGGEAAPAAVAATPAAAEPAAVAAAAAPVVTELVSHLKTENVRLNDVAARATLALETANTKVTAITADQEPLLAIVRAGCEKMGVALNSQNPTLATMSAKDVVELHGKLSVELTKRFPVGGRAASTAETQTPPGDAPQKKTGNHSVAVAAARIGPK